MTSEQGRYSSEMIHVNAIAEAIDIANAHPDAKGFLVIDLDDVRDDTRWSMWRKLHFVIGRRHTALRDRLPSFEDIQRRGMRVAFKELIGDIYYEHIWKAIEAREGHFRNAPLVDEDLPQRFKEITDAGFVPILWLTARDQKMTDVSRKVGVRKGLPDLPVFAMYPSDENVTAMKTAVVCELAQKIGKPITMIDDNAALIEALDELGNPNVSGILYQTPRTTNSRARRKANWSTMLGVLLNR